MDRIGVHAAGRKLQGEGRKERDENRKGGQKEKDESGRGRRREEERKLRVLQEENASVSEPSNFVYLINSNII